jgi:hypothetical protein
LTPHAKSRSPIPWRLEQANRPQLQVQPLAQLLGRLLLELPNHRPTPTLPQANQEYSWP